MKPTLGLRTSQQLALTPQLQQSIRLLQLSTAELEQEIEQFLADNPLLEITEPERIDHDHEDHNDHHDEQLPGSAENWSVGGKGARDEDDEQDWMAQRAAATGLVDHLHEQAMALKLSPRDRAWLKVLIESLDDDGYLRDGLDEIEEGIGEAFEAAFGERLEEDEQLLGLTLLQAMDPAGVGARDLSECLRLQLSRQQEAYGPEEYELAQTIVRESTLLEAVGARDFNRLCQSLKCDRDTLREVLAIITRLNPKPGGAFRQDAAEAVIPDVIAFRTKTRQGTRWQVRLNESAVPRLTINPVYAEMIRQDKTSSMSGQLQEARWVIKNIQQRCDTILRVAQAIAKEQHAFFEQGETAMRPLVLREIAQQCELHESTVSRVTTNKYILTPMGTFELKFFFTSHVGTEDGGTASSTAIRAKIKQWIALEDPRKPLSDQQIADRFALEGVQVARRTIAKYREALRIDPVSQRKKL